MNLRLLPNFVLTRANGDIVPDSEIPDEVHEAVDLLMRINRCDGHYMASDDGILHYSGPTQFVPALRAHRDVVLALLSAPPPEPCRGGCGRLVPTGQSCTACAVREVEEWREEKERKKRGNG
jgi:hypothetical protein